MAECTRNACMRNTHYSEKISCPDTETPNNFCPSKFFEADFYVLTITNLKSSQIANLQSVYRFAFFDENQNLNTLEKI